MVKVEIRGDRELKIYLDNVPKRLRTQMIGALGKSVRLLERGVKTKLSNQVLNVRTGALRRSITTEIHEQDMVGRVGTNLIYAPVHEFGATIHPKTAPYLWFKLQIASRIMSKRGGFLKKPKGIYTWIRTKEVTIPARPYMKPTFDEKVAAIQRIFELAVERAMA